jgi:ubiquinone/menaquinone biosynthesis C-methylase UbiE
MEPDVHPVVQIYRKRAKHFDITANRFYLLGFRSMAYRRQAVQALDLKPGDTVVDAGCGTGLNFGWLQRAVGPTGHIIGVDLTDAMLTKAEQRVRRHGWSNVTLLQDDLTTFAYPAGVNGILASLTITFLPEYDDVIARGYDALVPGGRWVVFDFKLPTWWPKRYVRLLNPLVAPFGGDVSMADRRPWDSVADHGTASTCSDRYFGFAYIAIGVSSDHPG